MDRDINSNLDFKHFLYFGTKIGLILADIFLVGTRSYNKKLKPIGQHLHQIISKSIWVLYLKKSQKNSSKVFLGYIRNFVLNVIAMEWKLVHGIYGYI